MSATPLIDQQKYPPLNLPPFAPKVRRLSDQIQIFDQFRQKYVALTPEEWVRQHFAHAVVNHLCVPKSCLWLEAEIQYARLRKRPDILVRSPHGEHWLLVECKASDVPLSASVLDQAVTYASVLRPRFIAITNGLTHRYFAFQSEMTNFVEITELPEFEGR